jgi:hypothetical protein
MVKTRWAGMTWRAGSRLVIPLEMSDVLEGNIRVQPGARLSGKHYWNGGKSQFIGNSNGMICFPMACYMAS